MVMRVEGLGDLDPHAFGAPIWAMVHGFASFLVSRASQLSPDPHAIHGYVSTATLQYFHGNAFRKT
ncbi:MAG: hypothetical protein AAGF15_08500 [Pseudomonadota bacterium]